jgi:murein endopeptidase
MRAVLLFVVLALALTFSPAYARSKKKAKKRVAIATALDKQRKPERELVKAKPEKVKPRGQSIGAAWGGRLESAGKFKAPNHTFVRRAHRQFATKTTLEHTRRVIIEVFETFPKLHTLAIGDFSAPRGGFITEHHSHQSGRDVDLGLFYKQRPAGYPENFVDATAETLDPAPMWNLIANLANRYDEDGGTQNIFLDFELQGVIYNLAMENGVSVKRLDRIFQYPHGRGASIGLVRHEPNHSDHIHVRFKCAAADVQCR